MTIPIHDDADYIEWLKALFFLMAKVRREGLMSVECDIENPENENSIFSAFPKTLSQPYLDFATDILRMMVSGNLDSEEMRVYGDHATAGHVEAGEANAYLLKTIWLTLWASMCGYAPQLAIEFGRQAIPVRCKPRFAELEDAIKAAKQNSPLQRGKPETLDQAVDRFMASLERK
jgi:flagellar motor component MotA